MIDLSYDPLAKQPFGNTAKHQTYELCPFNVLILLPVLISQIMIELSSDPLAKQPFGNTAKHQTLITMSL